MRFLQPSPRELTCLASYIARARWREKEKDTAYVQSHRRPVARVGCPRGSKVCDWAARIQIWDSRAALHSNRPLSEP